MAETLRDKIMMAVGRLDAALDLVNTAHIPPELKHVKEFAEIGAAAIKKAMLAAWDYVDSPEATK